MSTTSTSAYLVCGPRGEALYPTQRENRRKFRNLGHLPRDMRQAVKPYDWAEMVTLSAKLCASNPLLMGAIRQQAEWAFAGDSWQPIYYGDHEQWGEVATDWLVQQVFPNALKGNVRTDLIKAMQVSAMGWKIHGDDLALFKVGADNMPQMLVIPGTRIGNGQKDGWNSTVTGGAYAAGDYKLNGMALVQGGRFNGLRIYNGIIFDEEDQPVAARVIGMKRDGDTFVETYADFPLGLSHGAHMASEYDWHGMGRPLPRTAAAMVHWQHKSQADDNFYKGIDLASRQTVVHSGVENVLEARGDAIEIVDATDSDGNATTVYVETLEGGDVKYIGSDQKLENFDYKSPHPNVEEFVKRNIRECLVDLGWPYELVDPSSTSRAPTRMVCDLANNSMWQTQCTGETRLSWFVKFAIGVGIQHKHIPPPPAGRFDEPYKWTFGYPAEMSIDQGNDVTASLKRLRYGLTSQRLEAARSGYVLKRVQRDRQKEAAMLMDNAAALRDYVKTKHGEDIPFLKCVEYFWQPSENGSAIASTPPQISGDDSDNPSNESRPNADD